MNNHGNRTAYTYEGNQFSSAETNFKSIAENKKSLKFVIERYFHPKVICVDQGGTCARLEDTILFLSRNLKREELLMEKTGYPDSNVHVREHETILSKLEALRRTLVCGGYDNELVFDFINEWVDRHTKVFDKPFEDFLQDRDQGINQTNIN